MFYAWAVLRFVSAMSFVSGCIGGVGLLRTKVGFEVLLVGKIGRAGQKSCLKDVMLY
jgi:hypothetical protein